MRMLHFLLTFFVFYVLITNEESGMPSAYSFHVKTCKRCLILSTYFTRSAQGLGVKKWLFHWSSMFIERVVSSLPVVEPC